MRLLIENRPATVRDFHEFERAKQIKREPIRRGLRGSMRAEFYPSSRRDFLAMRERLRSSAHFGLASERIDALEHDLRMRGVALPVPIEICQNEDCSLSLFYDGVSVRSRGDAIAWVIGGTTGLQGVGVKRELLDALQVKATQQNGKAPYLYTR